MINSLVEEGVSLNFVKLVSQDLLWHSTHQLNRYMWSLTTLCKYVYRISDWLMQISKQISNDIKHIIFPCFWTNCPKLVVISGIFWHLALVSVMMTINTCIKSDLCTENSLNVGEHCLWPIFMREAMLVQPPAIYSATLSLLKWNRGIVFYHPVGSYMSRCPWK